MVSDHCFTDCTVTVEGTEPMKPTTIKTRKLKVIDMSAFKSDIANITLKSTDLHRMVMKYNTHIQELLNTHAAEIEKTVCKRKMQPCLSDNESDFKVVFKITYISAMTLHHYHL